MISLSKNWAKYEFGQVFEVLSSKKHQINKSNYLETGTIPVIDQGKKRIVGYTNEESKKYVNSKGVIVFGDHTLTFKYIDFDFVVGADGTKVLKLIDSENFSLKFLFYQFLSRQYKILGYRRHFKIVKKDDFTIPPLKEQKRKVAKIDALFAEIDKAITLTEESLVQAKNLLPSVLKEVFETIDGEEKFLPELVKEGRYSIKRGPFGSSLKKQFFVPSGYKVYEQKHAIRDDFEIGEYFVNEEKYLELKAFDLKPRDIIISCSGTVGRIAVAPDNLMPGIINQALLKISLNEDEIEISFFTYWFNNYVNNGSLSTKGAAIKNIVSVKELKAIPIKVPSLNSQKEICNQFDRYSQLSKQTQSKLEDQLAYLKQLKSSILSKAFKGEL